MKIEMSISEALNYSQAELQRLNRYIDEALEYIDPSVINDEYRSALNKNDREGAVNALANFYRSRRAYDIPDFGVGPYDRRTADNGAVGIMREINIEYSFPGGRIDFLFNPTLENPPVNHEWMWQLNRHSWWLDMARAYLDTGDEGYAAAFNTQLLDWAAKTDMPSDWNAPGSAFRTIECGLRLMKSWQAAFNIFRASGSVSNYALAVMLGSMHRQAVHLFKNPTRGNWLLMETCGLYNFGALYHEFKDAEKFRYIATERIIAELEGQVLPDGLQFELSPDYHSVSLKCAEGIYVAATAVGKAHELPSAYLECMYKMAMAAVKLSTPAFTQPRTNDCFTMHTAHFTTLAAQIFPNEPAFKFVNTVRREGAPPMSDGASVFLPWSGFAVMRSDWSADAAYLCFDVGPLGMAHIHQDKLNINLFCAGQELIFDDGGGQYELSDKRSYAVSAYDHNTVTVDGLGQNRKEPKLQKEKIDAGWITNNTFDYAYGIYDDIFGDGERPAVHKREVRFCKPDFFIVRDTLTAADGDEHIYGLRFHMDTLNLKKGEGRAVIAEYDGEWSLFVCSIADPGEQPLEFEAFSGKEEPEVIGWYIGRNEEKNHPATTIVMSSPPSRVHHFTTVLIPFKKTDDTPCVKKTADGQISVSLRGTDYKIDMTGLDK